VGSDDDNSHEGRHVPNHAPTVASSVLHHDIAGRQQHLRAIVDLDYDVAGEKDPEIRRVGPVHTGFVAVLHVHLGSGFRCNHAVGEYEVMMKRMPPTGGKIPGAAGLSPEFG